MGNDEAPYNILRDVGALGFGCIRTVNGEAEVHSLPWHPANPGQQVIIRRALRRET